MTRTLLGVTFRPLTPNDRVYLSADDDALIGDSGDVILLLEPSKGFNGTITEIGTSQFGEPFQRTWTFRDDV